MFECGVEPSSEVREIDAVVDESGVAHPAVVKIHFGADARDRALREAAALSAARHDHVVRLLDVDEGSDGMELVLERLTRETASDWLRRRRSIDAGEAVTLTVPVLRAVQHLHRRGVALGRLSLDQILFDGRGSPVLVGVRHDDSGRIDVRLFVLTVLAATEGGAEDARGRLRGLVTATDRGPGFDELLEAALDLAAPVPLEQLFGGSRSASRPGSPSGSPPLPVSRASGPASERAAGPFSGVLGSMAPVFAVVELAAASAFAVRSLEVLRSVRPRVWLMVALVAGSALVAGVVTGGSESHDSAMAPTPSTSSPVPSTSREAGDRSEADRGGPEREAVGSTAADRAALLGDEAEQATGVLLRLRDACLRDLDQACLAGVDQAGTALLVSDVEATNDPASVPDRPTGVVAEALLNDLGGSAVVRGRGVDGVETSILVVKGVEGWRLRDIAIVGG